MARRLSRNARFLLELNRAGSRKERQRAMKVDMYPETEKWRGRESMVPGMERRRENTEPEVERRRENTGPEVERRREMDEQRQVCMYGLWNRDYSHQNGNGFVWWAILVNFLIANVSPVDLDLILLPQWHRFVPDPDQSSASASPGPSSSSLPRPSVCSQSVPSGVATFSAPLGSPPSPLLHSLLAFVCAPLDLPSLRHQFRSSFFRAVAFSFAFRLWGWLIKLTTSDQRFQFLDFPTLDFRSLFGSDRSVPSFSVLDVLWHFLSAFHPSSCSSSSSLSLLPHPANLCPLAGPLATDALQVTI